MPVKIAVIGAGKFGTLHLDAFTQLGYVGIAELSAVVENNPRRAEELSRQYNCRIYSDYRDMLDKEDVVAVSIATPDHLHREISVAASKAGKHVLVEKPLDTTVEGCIEMIEAAKNAGKLLMVDFHKRYDPDHQNIEARIREGSLGNILYGSVCMEDRIEVPVNWFPHWAPKSSPAWFLGVHFYDLVRWIIKSEPVSVYATGVKNILLNEYGIDTYDAINAKVVFANSASFNFDTSWVLPNEFESIVNQEIRIVGTKGVWECDSQYRGSRSCIASEGMRTYNMGFRKDTIDKYGRPVIRGYGVESIQDFAYNVQFIEQGGKIEDIPGCWASGEDGLAVTKIADAVHRSIESGEVVAIAG